MTTNPPERQDVSSYIDVLDRFIERSMTAAEFEATFLTLMKFERRVHGEPVYSVLQELFEDADAYVARPELRTKPDDLDDEQLLQSARRAREALRSIGIA